VAQVSEAPGPGTGDQPPAWDLSSLVPGGPSGAVDLGEQAVAAAKRFAIEHEGRIAAYGADELRQALEQLEAIHAAMIVADAYATLRFDADTGPPEHGALLNEIEAQAARVQTLVNFFELEWLAVAPERAAALFAQPEVERFAHLLAVRRRLAPHRLSGPEERLLTEKGLTGREAWRRLLDEQLAAMTAPWEGESRPLTEVQARLSSPDRAQRRAAEGSITSALAPGLRIRASVLNVLLADHAVDDRLRRYPHWLAERNLENEAGDASVDALVAAVVARYDIPRRWSTLKARALGVEQLHSYDRAAAVGAPPERFAWAEARGLVLAAYRSFSPELAEQATRFFTQGWIDAAIRPGKQVGAYCAHTGPTGHPYLLMNFAGLRQDVLTLAHELGHGLHYLLAAPRGLLQMDTPATVAETASVFGETLTFAHLLAQASEPEARFGLLAYQLDEAVATVFQQIAIHRFEDHVHRERREHGELSAGRFSEHWQAVNEELFGDALVFTAGQETRWSYVEHVFNIPGYVYAYAYGQLLALSIYARYLEQGESFVPRYLELLSAGGSRSPEELAAIVGADLGDPTFWDTGLALIDGQLREAELALAAVAP
jgi:oligoendopeptidase F